MKPSKYNLGIRCDYLLTMAQGKSEILTDYFIGIKNSKIETIEKWKPSLKINSKKFLHAKKQLVMPGLVNGHTHLAMTLFRGIEDDIPLSHWLFDRILPLERRLVDAQFIKLGTELAALECLRFGTTTICDQYFFAQTAAEVWDRVGLRGIFAQVFSQYPLPEDAALGKDKEKLFLKLFNQLKKHPRLTAALGPHAPYSCDDKILKSVAELSKKYQAPVHIHVSETETEVNEHFKNYKVSPTERLYNLNLLGPNTICAHCVYLNEKDQELFKKTKTSIIHNPDSNFKLASGVAPIPTYLKQGLVVGLGTDGCASNNNLNLFGAMNLATKVQKVFHKNSLAMTASQALKMATLESAKALGIEDQVGSLEVGKRADILFIDLELPHMQPIQDLVSHLVYSATGMEVHTVICDGKILMKNRKILTLNESQIYKKVHVYQKKIKTELDIIKKENPL
ncbi:MAG TPA: amidohydrolase [Pseudobdellovibrionaceae bacterium]|nr:amidohydrolase [Pseudobdellovibrionaceae bacterium]